ncbi:MAG TPA: FKBP-type peptidyl-prolyl cis-trans isomerase [Solirubrobacteraceae bacterium]|jgi:FKBP-type peptidyl-prolyl cis-trans isomerase|nr:FKBP-type peptidyl-prolyl cis-trans isomerase [Solirubrobacteraceae bacterium]
MKTTALLPLAGLAALGALAGCGSSSNTSNIPAAAAPTTVAASALPTVPPALKSEPTITVPKGPPPKTLKVINLVTGTGPAIKTGDSLTGNYVGVLYKTGKVFSSSWTTGTQGFNFTLKAGVGGVIAGWVQGLQGMRVGGRRQLIIPPALAYGATGSPPTIPGNSTLVFDVDIDSLNS